MHTDQWRLQDAKARFSQVVEAALRGEPQHITRRGRRAVVVLSEQEFESLQRNAHAAAPGFIAHLLAMPREKDESGADRATDHAPLALREVDFS